MAQKYNLRSGKKETVLPVQLQLCDDQDFMSQVLGGSHPTPSQRQVHSDLSSGSDFDISDLVQSSDNDMDVSDTEHIGPMINLTLKIKFRMIKMLAVPSKWSIRQS